VNIIVEDLHFSYNSVPVLEHIDFELGGGKVLGLVGPNGAGKSTLLKCINRILLPNSGRVLYDGKPHTEMERRELATLVGYIPQQTAAHFPMPVFDVLLMGRASRMKWRPREKDLDIVSNIIISLGIDHLAMKDITMISGGERQKVLLGRALAQTPRLLLLDEPINNLDMRHQLQIMDILIEEKEKGVSSVVCIHDLSLASKYCDTIILIEKGKIVERGKRKALEATVLERTFEVEVSLVEREDRCLIVPERPIRRG